MSKLAVFDVDGTFLDSLGFFRDIIREYSAAEGLPMPCMTSIQLGYGDPMNHDFKWGVSREEQLRHLKNTWEICDRRGEEGPAPALYDGARATLVAMKQAGHTLAIVTSKPEKPLLRVLEDHRLKELFSACRSLCDVKKLGKREKPEPDMLLSVMDELSFRPENTAMIGDTTMDILMGVRAGTRAIGVAWGAHPSHQLVNAGAHHIVDTGFPDIAKAVKSILR